MSHTPGSLQQRPLFRKTRGLENNPLVSFSLFELIRLEPNKVFCRAVPSALSCSGLPQLAEEGDLQDTQSRLSVDQTPQMLVTPHKASPWQQSEFLKALVLTGGGPGYEIRWNRRMKYSQKQINEEINENVRRLFGDKGYLNLLKSFLCFLFLFIFILRWGSHCIDFFTRKLLWRPGHPSAQNLACPCSPSAKIKGPETS